MEATSLANELREDAAEKVQHRGNPNVVADTADKTPRYGGINSTLEDGFFNDIDPRFKYSKEKPIHRLMVFLCAQGLSNIQIAERLSVSATNVSQVLKQPWAREQLIHELKEAGQDELRGLLKGAATDAIHKLIDLSEKAKSESVQLGASQAILDRFLGKPNQPLTVANVDPEQLPDSELAKLIKHN